MTDHTATVAGSVEAGERFADLIEAHRRIVFKVSRTYAWATADRADLAQEIVAQLWRAFPSYDAGRPFSTWMYRIALNVAISDLRSRQRRERRTVPLDDSHDVAQATPDDAADDERVRRLQRVIAALDPLNRALLLLYLEDHSSREMADILGISETNVSTKISRLKQRIRRDLAGVHP